MTQEEIGEILERYLAGKASSREQALLDQWFNERSYRNWRTLEESERTQVREAMQAHVVKELFPQTQQRFLYLKRMAVAASVILLSACAFWLYRNTFSVQTMQHDYAQQAVAPGSNVAYLTLEDGSTVFLDDTIAGLVHHKEGVYIHQSEIGELHYRTEASESIENSAEDRKNTMHVPRGGQYRIVLPDGTKVSLNSASTLTYPVAFSSEKRMVTLIGEAYFEVAKNKEVPFLVKANDTEVHVTGTKFNITAYQDEEQVTTTLIEGGVNVAKEHTVVNLVPGQQAVSHVGSPEIKRYTVDVDYVLAWLDGNFLFEHQNIQTIMKNISRWYDVDISYVGDISYTKTFGGTYTRSKGLEELLKHLESLSDFRFELKERRVTVMN